MTYGSYPSREGVKKVLVIKLRHLGDVLLTTPFFHCLQKALPSETKIDAYVYKEAAPILSDHPAIHRLWLRDPTQKSFFQEVAFLWKLRKERYDWILNLTEGDRGAIVAGVAGAQVSAGFLPKGKWQRKFYTHPVKQTPGLRHAVERNLDVLRCLGIFPPLEDRKLFFHVPEEEKRMISSLVGKERYVLIHPTSRWRYKCYPPRLMRALIFWLQEQGERVVVSSGPSFEERKWVADLLQGVEGVVDLSGKTTIKGLGALVEGASCVICVDSFCLHLTSALKKRVIALFGPTSDITWAPWLNPDAQVVAESLSCRPCYQDGCGGSKYSDCLERLSLDQIKRVFTNETTLRSSSDALLGL